MLFSHMLSYGMEGFVADDVLDAAGVRSSGFFIDAQAHEKIGKHGVALIYFSGDITTLLGQSQVSVFARS